MPRSLMAIGASSDLGVHVDGARLGPATILSRVKDSQLPRLLLPPAIYKKHRATHDKAKNLVGVLEYNLQLYKIIATALSSGYKPIMIGGDHSLSIASGLASLDYHQNLGLIWLDAHTDFHTLKTTITGNLHGLPLACLCGAEKQLTTFDDCHYYDPSKVVIVGARSVDDPEWDNLCAAGVHIFTNQAIREQGLISVLERAWNYATNDTRGLHFSFDLDVLDPQIAPGVSVPVPDGLRTKDLSVTLDFFKRHWEDIQSFDLVEYNPRLDRDHQTLTLAERILQTIIDINAQS
ncbi:arginase family protein [bacterium]|nr:arginase family protein [bacterium]